MSMLVSISVSKVKTTRVPWLWPFGLSESPTRMVYCAHMVFSRTSPHDNTDFGGGSRRIRSWSSPLSCHSHLHLLLLFSCEALGCRLNLLSFTAPIANNLTWESKNNNPPKSKEKQARLNKKQQKGQVQAHVKTTRHSSWWIMTYVNPYPLPLSADGVNILS